MGLFLIDSSAPLGMTILVLLECLKEIDHETSVRIVSEATGGSLKAEGFGDGGRKPSPSFA